MRTELKIEGYTDKTTLLAEWDNEYRSNTPLEMSIDGARIRLELDQARHLRNFINAILNYHGQQ